MTELMSYCGILCNECPAYIATVNNDDTLRKKTAIEWTALYQADIQPEHINCLGCHSDVRIAYCQMCEIRKCVTEKKYAHCGLCADFVCDHLLPVFQHAPECKERLEKSR